MSNATMPRTRWSYSNTGFILLGRIVERLSGKSFGEFLSERILKPLGMNDTVYDPKEDHRGLAIGHSAFALGDPEPTPREARGWIHAAGALYSTPADLVKWDLALVGGDLDHEQRVADRDVEAAALADRVAGDAFVAAEHPAVHVHDVARFRALRAQAVDDRRVTAFRHEADVLAVGLVRRR